MAESILESKRARVWAVLGVLLIAAIVLLVLAMQTSDKPDGPPPAPVELLVVDEAGVPIKNAVTVVRRKTGAAASTESTWHPDTATLSLAAEDSGATVLIGSPGHRVVRLVDVKADQTVILPRGYTVRIRMAGDAPPLEPPLVGLFRVRPSDTTSSLGEGEDARPLDLSGLMVALHRSRPDALELPFAVFGFAVSESDAAAGFRVPAPGTYVAVWGMLDEGPGTWFTHKDCPPLLIDVKDQDEAQVFDFTLDRELWNRTREGLKERIEQIRGGG